MRIGCVPLLITAAALYALVVEAKSRYFYRFDPRVSSARTIIRVTRAACSRKARQRTRRTPGSSFFRGLPRGSGSGSYGGPARSSRRCPGVRLVVARSVSADSSVGEDARKGALAVPGRTRHRSPPSSIEHLFRYISKCLDQDLDVPSTLKSPSVSNQGPKRQN